MDPCNGLLPSPHNWAIQSQKNTLNKQIAEFMISKRGLQTSEQSYITQKNYCILHIVDMIEGSLEV